MALVVLIKKRFLAVLNVCLAVPACFALAIHSQVDVCGGGDARQEVIFVCDKCLCGGS